MAGRGGSSALYLEVGGGGGVHVLSGYFVEHIVHSANFGLCRYSVCRDDSTPYVQAEIFFYINCIAGQLSYDSLFLKIQ